MILFIECIVGIALFTLIVVPMALRDPIGMIGDYPPAIKERCEELGLIEKRKRQLSKKELIRKAIGVIVLVILAAFIMIKVNHANTFLQGFGWTYIIWLAITWYDALILDCGWFCHSKRMRMPGT